MVLDSMSRENKGKEPCPHGAKSHDLATPQPLAKLQALVPSSLDRLIKGVNRPLAGRMRQVEQYLEITFKNSTSRYVLPVTFKRCSEVVSQHIHSEAKCHSTRAFPMD